MARMTDPSRITVVFDTDCILCSSWVGFLLRHESGERLHFASSRKPVGQQLAAQHGLDVEDLDLTYLVITDGRCLTKTDASLALLGQMHTPWRWLGLMRFVPRRIRDGLYDIVARNRLRWFGTRQDCFLPTPAQRLRFLDDVPDHRQPVGGPE